MPVPDLHQLPGTDVLVPFGTGRPRRLHVVEHGRATGRLPLLMLAEPPATSYLWRDVARDLEREWRSYMPDLPGCGASECPTAKRHFAIDVQADELRALLDQLQLPQVAVVASGIAGALAVEMAARCPDRVAALILVGTPLHPEAWPTAGVLPLLMSGSGDVLIRTLGRRSPERVRGYVARLLGTADGPDLDHYAAPLRRPDCARAFLRLLRSVDMQALRGARELVATGPPPTLVLWGEHDQLLSIDYGRRVAGELSATWVPIAGAGHLVARERPERVAEEIVGFLTGPAVAAPDQSPDQ